LHVYTTQMSAHANTKSMHTLVALHICDNDMYIDRIEEHKSLPIQEHALIVAK
jgi:hypothetical protein